MSLWPTKYLEEISAVKGVVRFFAILMESGEDFVFFSFSSCFGVEVALCH